MDPISNWEIFLRIILSAGVGILVGWERERINRPAGLRTYALVCVGSTMFTLLSIYAFGASEPSRVAAQIITGIGFLGAGTIFKYKNKVLGLTTAAGLWAIAGVGMGYGAGYYLGTTIGAVIIFALLRLNKASKTRKKIEREYQELKQFEHKHMHIDHFVKKIEKDEKMKKKKRP
ncbi:MAG: MgtC/SapB family protein [Nanoarchaeota archaeon]